MALRATSPSDPMRLRMLRAKLRTALGKDLRAQQLAGLLLTKRSDMKSAGVFGALHASRGMPSTPLLVAAQSG